MSDHFDLLISAYLDGELDDGGVAELEAWLDADREHRRRFLGMTHAHRALIDRARTGGADASAARAIAAAGRAAARDDEPSIGSSVWRASPAAATGEARAGGGDARAAARSSARLRAMSGRRRAVPGGTRAWTMPAAVLAAAVVVAVLAQRGDERAPDPARAREAVAPAIRATASAAAYATVVSAADASLGGAPLAVGATLGNGARIAVGPGGALALRLADGTAVRVDPATALTLSGGGATGTRIVVARGRVALDVTPQPAGRAVVIAAGGAEVAASGASLTVALDGGATRTAVTRGRAVLTRLADGASVPLTAGHDAVAAPGVALGAHALGETTGAVDEIGSSTR